MATTKNAVSRRSFLAAAGAAAATAAVAAPVLPTLAGSQSSRLPPRGAFLEGLRALYAAELGTFAESLRPRFEAGELRACRSPEDDNSGRDGPQWKIEAIVVEHFGLQTTTRAGTEGWLWTEGDDATAHMILAVSPHAYVTGEGTEEPCEHAREAVTWDVIALARERGWYAPTETEDEDPLDWAARHGGARS